MGCGNRKSQIDRGLTLNIPMADKFVDLPPGSLMAYPGSEFDHGMEITVSGKVHDFEDSAVRRLTIDPKNPVAPGGRTWHLIDRLIRIN
ncbi:MAG: hypothetical protein US11_C0003G0048 [Candidatus Roizmanbacteria bacterium GW2011_GWA2_36_23]|uniref:Uncharacterized protein n=1 Tax=Candidatus Roizmanbacteria bacterium GW2011_GWA2_36_23 TaxID=1618480 RepID=A0A0G0ELA1_9BACT|nr:MAG: hypothetical protein US11_C0003G0048 [Candidatus Roizmanbacteria bacterium GW2011_GWA2_36_23]